ncbi:threonine/serine ThrE exporter family protein [Bifidobacterium fermentum]|uniref:Threonine/serine exporter family protein n=1 Tax=Bifidobacterium fermentum TaxID=3059035 RepID=A0AB39UIR3_9BIFI
MFIKGRKEAKNLRDTEREAEDKVSGFHSHALPLDMEDIIRDFDTPVTEAGLAAKTSLIVRVGMLDLGAGTGSFRVREMMHRIAFPLGVHVRSDVNLTDIEATCTDGKERMTEVVDLPTTGVNTERIWLLEHFADWFSVRCGLTSIYHHEPTLSTELVDTLGTHESEGSALRAVKTRRKRLAAKLPTGDYAKHFEHHQPDSLAHGMKPITVREAHARLDTIERRHPLYSPQFAGLASAVACASFVFLLGGGPIDMLGAFIGAGVGHYIRRLLLARHINQFFVTFVVVAIAVLACVGTLRFFGIFYPSALEHDTAYIGATLFVIPGFPLVTGGLDIAKIDYPSGIQRLTYALSIILMATFAGWAVARIVMLNPQGFAPLGLNDWTNGLLRFAMAFGGVWGFSVMFNSPQRMALTAASIGAITDTLRLEIQDLFGVPPEAAAFVGAFIAGILASFWRSAVRRGWLPPHLGYPRICLTVPSIVIMVPGLYMYRAMFYLGQFNTLHALDWGFRAFMVILCLPVGLAMARVITDRSWRYDK